MKQSAKFKEGQNVLVKDIYEDHPAHRDEESGDLPKGIALRNLKRFLGCVGTVENSWYTGGFEAHWVVLVRFANNVEDTFSEDELLLTEEGVTENIPEEIIEDKPNFKELSQDEKDFAKSVFEKILTCADGKHDIDSILSDVDYYLHKSILISRKMHDELGLLWVVGEEV